MRIGAADPSLTAVSGLAAVDAAVDRLGLVAALDVGLGPIKTRARGATGGQLLVGLAAAQLTGVDSLTGCDRRRVDAGAALLTTAPVPASTTAAGLARRMTAPQVSAGMEAGLATVYRRWLDLVPGQRRTELVLRRPTIDGDSTDIEVFADKEQVGWNYAGMRCGRLHALTWAAAELPLAADLVAGNADPRPAAPELIRRALAVLPPQVVGMPQVRLDAGFFAADVAHACVTAGADFAIAAKRNRAVVRAATAIPDDAWQPCRGMPYSATAVCDYAPEGWPPGSYTIARRTTVPADRLSTDPRARRSRTIPAEARQLALDGTVPVVYAYSFLVTNIPADDRDAVSIEAWFRRRTSIEDRFREAKYGAGLNHLPSASHTVNTTWAWAGLLAGALSVMLQALARLDIAPHRARIATLRHRLICVPGRLIRHARTLTLRLPPGHQLLAAVLDRLRTLPTPT